jgi:hypothetical protein
MLNIFRRKKFKVHVKGEGVDKTYSVYRISKTEPQHVKLTTDQGKMVEIRSTTPMDIIVEEL